MKYFRYILLIVYLTVPIITSGCLDNNAGRKLMMVALAFPYLAPPD